MDALRKSKASWDQAGETRAAASNIHAREIMVASLVWPSCANK
jgi:hypothetical protein